MKALHLLIALGVAVAATVPANACVVNNPPGVRIGQVRADTVILATVREATYTGQRKPDYRPWRGHVQLKKVLRGSTSTQRFSIARSGSSAACDDGITPPARGDIWVIYLGRRDGKQIVLLSYPLAIARAADPTLFSRKTAS